MSIDAEGVDLMTWKLCRADSVARAQALKRQASVRASNHSTVIISPLSFIITAITFNTIFAAFCEPFYK